MFYIQVYQLKPPQGLKRATFTNERAAANRSH